MQILLEADLAGEVAHDLQKLRTAREAGALAELNYRLLAEDKGQTAC